MLRIVPHTVPRVGRSYEHFPDGFELHLLLCVGDKLRAGAWGRVVSAFMVSSVGFRVWVGSCGFDSREEHVCASGLSAFVHGHIVYRVRMTAL